MNFKIKQEVDSHTIDCVSEEYAACLNVDRTFNPSASAGA